MALAVIEVLLILLTILWWILVVQLILSLLVTFNVINTYNEFVRTFMGALNRIAEPLYRPIRRVLPDFGGIDFSPFVVLTIILIVDRLLRGVGNDIIRYSGG